MSKVYVYRTEIIDEQTHPDAIEDLLNEWAEEGWRLHSMVRRVRVWFGPSRIPSAFDLILTFEAKVDPSPF